MGGLDSRQLIMKNTAKPTKDGTWQAYMPEISLIMNHRTQDHATELLLSVDKMIKLACRKAARNLKNYDSAFDEFYADCRVDVWKAAKNFDPERGKDFSNLAAVTISNCIKRTRERILNTGYKCGDIFAVVNDIKREFGVNPTIKEIRDELKNRGVSVDESTIAKTVKTVVSMDSEFKSYSDSKSRPLSECIAGEDVDFDLPTEDDFRWALARLCHGDKKMEKAAVAFYLDAVDKKTICTMTGKSMPTVNKMLEMILKNVKANIETEPAQVFIDFVRSGQCNFPERGQAA